MTWGFWALVGVGIFWLLAWGGEKVAFWRAIARERERLWREAESRRIRKNMERKLRLWEEDLNGTINGRMRKEREKRNV